MRKSLPFVLAAIAVMLAVSSGKANPQQDRYTVKVPGGLAFSEFRGYESWQVISISHDNGKLAVILGDPAMIKAYESGIPENGKPFPDGVRMAKIHWNPVQMDDFKSATVPGTQIDADFMVRDSKRFADSGGWGWAAFEYDAASKTFAPATTTAMPPQDHDAKCGFKCHTIAKDRDYVFTKWATR